MTTSTGPLLQSAPMKLQLFESVALRPWIKPGFVVAFAGILVLCAYSGGRASAQGGMSVQSIKSRAKTGKPAGRGPSANVGQEIRVVGSGFPANASVEFTAFANSTFLVGPVTAEPRRIAVDVPNESITGAVRVVTPEGGSSNAQSLQVVPTIKSVTPANPAPGDRILIDGAGFSPDAKVIFKGVAQPVVPAVVSPVRIDVTVPRMAKTGPLVVATTGGKSKPMRLQLASGGSSQAPAPAPAATKPH